MTEGKACPETQSEIQAQVTMLSCCVRELSEMMDELSRRLVSVLRESYAKEARGDDDKVGQSLCPLANEICDIVHGVELSRTRGLELLERLAV